MRMSELAATTEVPVPTIKYYLREGLLHPGEPTSATRASYDETHIQRLRLIRALVDVAELKISAVRRVLATLDDDRRTMHELLGSAHWALSGGGGPAPAAARRRVDRLLRRLRWRIHPDSPHRDALARALDAFDQVGQPLTDRRLEVYADSALAVAEANLAGVPTNTPAETLRYSVLGAVLSEPVLWALRRLAHEDQSSRRFGRRGGRRS